MKLKLTAKFTLSCILLVVILSLIISMIGYYNYINGIMFESENHVLSINKGVVKSLKVEELKRFVEAGEKTPYINDLQDYFIGMGLDGNLEYIYMFQMDKTPIKGEISYVIMGYSESTLAMPEAKRPKLGDTEVYPPELYEQVRQVWDGEKKDLVIRNKTKWGYMLSAFVPVKDNDGKVFAILSTDFSMNYINKTVTRYFLYVCAGALIALIVLLIIYISIIKRTIIKPIQTLQITAMNVISTDSSELNKCITNIQTGDEIEDLSNSFNYMIGQLQDYIDNLSKVTAEKERIGAELNVATNIQASMLPSIFPPFPERDEFDIYATMLPAKEVGGDFYDFFLINDDNLGIVIADVSGKGVPAALFMVIAKTLIKNYAMTNYSVSEVFNRANNQLCDGNEAGMFVTAFMGVINLKTLEFRYVNAGHNPICIKKVNDDFEYLTVKPGFVLAGIEDIKYKESAITLDKGDCLYLYTDGVTEATNTQDELFSEQRLIDSLNQHKDLDLRELLAMVKKDIDAFVQEAPQFDDITMLAIKIN